MSAANNVGAWDEFWRGQGKGYSQDVRSRAEFIAACDKLLPADALHQALTYVVKQNVSAINELLDSRCDSD